MKRFFSAILAAAIMSGTASAIPYDEYMEGRTEYKNTSYVLSEGLTYSELITENTIYGAERSYIFEYTPGSNTDIVFSYGEYVYGTDTLGSLTQKLEDEGERVVGGVNGDFYTLATGVPLGIMIVDGELITSDDSRAALAFDSEGKAFISYPKLSFDLSGDKTSVKIDHINKVPHEYALNLLNSKFAKTTKTQSDSYEIVLMPYSEVIYHDDSVFEPRDVKSFIALKSDILEVEKALLDKKAEEAEQPSQETVMPEENKDDDSDVMFFFNDDVSSEEDETELVLPFEEPEFFAKEYILSDEALKIGSEIKFVVTEIRENSKNSEIPDGHYILCAENLYQSYRVNDIAMYDEFTLSIKAEDERFYNAVSAIGTSGGMILQDGEWYEDVDMDHYPSAHPRTAVGVTEDGRVIFYCVDGRRTGHSAGLRIDQLSHEMKKLGCVVAANFDGGGSTTVYNSLPGEFFSVMKNIPSISSERKTANSLIFVNTAEKSNDKINYFMYPINEYVFVNGSQYILPESLVAADENYHPISLSDDFAFEYVLNENEEDYDSEFLHSVSDGVFISGDFTGKVNISAKIDADGETVITDVGYVTVTDTLTDFTTFLDEYIILPFDKETIQIEAYYGPEKVHIQPVSVKWDISGKIIQNDDVMNDSEEVEEREESVEEEVYTVQHISFGNEEFIESDKGTIMRDGTYVPKTFGESYYISLLAGNVEKQVKISVLDFPFADSVTHWAARNIGAAYHSSIMNGETFEDALVFVPDRYLTRAEFVTILARLLMPEKFASDEVTEDILSDIEESSRETTEDEMIVEDDAEIIDEEIVELYDDNNVDSSFDSFVKSEDETDEGDLSDEKPSDDTTEEDFVEQERSVLGFADEEEIPEWSRIYFEALSNTGLLKLICEYDANGRYIKANEYISRADVMAMLGYLCDMVYEDKAHEFTDSSLVYESRNYLFINNALSTGIFSGYEDGSLGALSNLTRAEAATVIMRYIENTEE